jgi:hypothetical protein
MCQVQASSQAGFGEQEPSIRTTAPIEPHESAISCNDAESLSEDTSNEEADEAPTTNAAGVWKPARKPKKVTISTKKPAVIVKAVEPTKPIGELTEQEMRQALERKEAERREANRLAQLLTEEEKDMDLGELHRKWKLEAQQRRQEKMQLNPFDFDALGKLVGEERNFTKSQVRKLIHDRKHEKWIASMKAQGVPLHICETCQELATPNHRCIATRWKTEGPYGRSRGLFVTQDNGGNVRFTEKQVTDPEKVEKEWMELNKMREELAQRTTKLHAAMQSSTQNESSPTDVPMDGSATPTATAPTTPPTSNMSASSPPKPRKGQCF